MTIAAPPAPVRIGPEGLPRWTLGWQILGWTREYLLQPDGPNAGEPWDFTNEQARFVLWWFAVDERGRFIYRRGMFRRMKGHGKDPLGAALCSVEFVGPCRFGGWDRNHEPIAIPHSAAWVQTAAVSKEQTRNTMTLFPGMLSPRAIDEYGIDLGKEIIYAHGGKCRIEAVTSSPRSLEGGRPSFTLKNEPHHWLKANEGLEMSAVIARNAAKSSDGASRVLSISNAHSPGEGSDAELDWEAWQKMEIAGGATDFLYDSLEAPEDVDMDDDEQLRSALIGCRGDSVWLDVERLVAEIRDPRTDRSTARRFYLNQIAAKEERAFSKQRWDELQDKRRIPDGATIVLGFDGSTSRDHTALIATDVASGYQWVAGYWEPRMIDGEMKVPVDEVDQTLAAVCDRWKVWRINADPFYWMEWLAAWAGRYDRPGHKVVVSWNTTQYRRMAFALLAYRQAMDAGDLSHDGDPRFSAAIASAHKLMQNFTDDNGERMWTIQKSSPESSLKIDAAMAGCLSWEARLAAISDGALNSEEQKVPQVWI